MVKVSEGKWIAIAVAVLGSMSIAACGGSSTSDQALTGTVLLANGRLVANEADAAGVLSLRAFLMLLRRLATCDGARHNRQPTGSAPETPKLMVTHAGKVRLLVQLTIAMRTKTVYF